MNYQEQANKFLQETNTVLQVKFLKNDLYFSDDEETRDIFSCRLSNLRHSYRFRFGQSLKKSTGSGKNKPTAYDILSCLQKYEIATFEDFCDEYGYDTDSRKAFRTYKAVKKEWENVRLLFTPEELEQLQEIQ